MPRRCSRGSAPTTAARSSSSREHSERLRKSAELLGFELPWSVEEIDAACNEVLKANGFTDAYMRPVAWRGSEQMGVAPKGTKPHLAIAAGNGANISTRRSRQGHPPRHRAVAAARALHRADRIQGGRPVHDLHAVEAACRGRGYDDALMFDWRGQVAEATGANAFFVATARCTRRRPTASSTASPAGR
jgi:branched-chain amino acid aminotransferase